MSKLAMTIIMKDYDYIVPILLGEVAAEDMELTIDHKTSIAQVTEDIEVPAGEASFSKHLIMLGHGDRRFVGIPFFAYRAFRQRCFLVRRGSGLRDLKGLEGKRIGTNAWPDTGNTWSRAALREQGVKIEKIKWWVGPPYDLNYAKRYEGTEPKYVQPAAPGRTLRDMLLADELDCMMVPIPPKDFYDKNSPIVRIYPDYRRVEQEYYHRTGIYPGHHIIVVRREVFEKQPWIAPSLYNALDKSRVLWQEHRLDLAELTPWSLPDIEDTIALMGRDWHPNGVQANRKVIQALCDEEYAQGLIPKPLDASSVFADFEKAVKG